MTDDRARATASAGIDLERPLADGPGDVLASGRHSGGVTTTVSEAELFAAFVSPPMPVGRVIAITNERQLAVRHLAVLIVGRWRIEG